MMDIPALSVVIPAFNEENAIGDVMLKLHAALPDAELIVVDDGSTDQTPEIAADVGVGRVFRHPNNRGYGAALRTGTWAARGEYVAWFDADNQHNPDDLVAMLAQIDESRASAVLSQRRNPNASLIRMIGKWVIRLFARSLRFSTTGDLNSGLRIFRRTTLLPYLSLLPNGFSASLTSTVLFLERGYPVEFFTIKVNPRIGTSTVRVAHGFRVLMALVRVTMLFAPLRIFLKGGVFLLLAGITYSLYVAFTEGTGIPVAGLLVVVTGLILSAAGLLADQISQGRLAEIEKNVSLALFETDEHLGEGAAAESEQRKTRY